MNKELRKKLRHFWKKFWYVVWKDQSFKGWIISIIFIFIVIKLIFFPLLNLATGTTLPLAIVESCSMHHKGNLFSSYQSWWDRQETKYSEFDITKTQFDNFKMKRGFSKGDIILIVGKNQKK